jgi:DNA end-binding protein Ku
MSTEKWDPTEHPDEYKKALEKLLAPKKAVSAPKGPAESEGGKVIDLMAALKASLGKTASSGRAPARRAPRTAHAPRARARRTPRGRAGAA